LALKAHIQDPDARLRMAFNWSPFLQEGDEVDTVEYEYSPELAVTPIGVDSPRSRFWLEAEPSAEIGPKYFVTGHMETQQGEKQDLTLPVKFKEN
jgi:hypothetical protein